MKSKSVRHVMVLAAASFVTGLCLPITTWAVGTINPGSVIYNDDFVGGPTFEAPLDLGEPEFQGVPLNIFDFGPPYGLQNVGSTDTIIQRPGFSSDFPATVNIQMNALQVQSVAPVIGTDEYDYLNLDSSTPSTGTMTINASGTYTSTLNVYYDVWTGAIGNGTPVTGELTLNASGNWSHNAPLNALLIPGVNYLLDGVDTSADFWPAGPVIYSDSSGDQLELEPTSVPEPSTLALLGLGMLCLAIKTRRGRK